MARGLGVGVDGMDLAARLGDSGGVRRPRLGRDPADDAVQVGVLRRGPAPDRVVPERRVGVARRGDDRGRAARRVVGIRAIDAPPPSVAPASSSRRRCSPRCSPGASRGTWWSPGATCSRCSGPPRRRDLWPLAFAPVLGALVSVGWNSVVGDLWKTDAAFFGVHVNPGRQRHLLVTEPWHFAGAVVHTVADETWGWAKQLFTMGPSVAVWPTVAVVAAVLVMGRGLAAAGTARSRTASRGRNGSSWRSCSSSACCSCSARSTCTGRNRATTSSPGCRPASSCPCSSCCRSRSDRSLALGPVGDRTGAGGAGDRAGLRRPGRHDRLPHVLTPVG